MTPATTNAKKTGSLVTTKEKESSVLRILKEHLEQRERNPVLIGELIEQVKAEMTEALDKYVAVARRGDLNKPLTDAEYRQMSHELRDTPEWLMKILERARKTHRVPKVGWEDVGARTGFSRQMVNIYVRLANLPSDIKADIHSKKIGFGRAEFLIQIDDVNAQRTLAHEIKTKSLSDAQVRRRIRELQLSPSTRALDSKTLSWLEDGINQLNERIQVLEELRGLDKNQAKALRSLRKQADKTFKEFRDGIDGALNS